MKPEIFLRYKNRKLYCKQTATHVNMGHILDRQLDGAKVEVYSNPEGVDITTEVLSAAIVDRFGSDPEFLRWIQLWTIKPPKGGDREPGWSVQGTPKTLEGACLNAIREVLMTPACRPKAAARAVHAHVKDFLAQKTGALFLSPNEAVREAADEMWSAVTGSGKKVDL